MKKRKNENRAERYFNQKNFLAVEIVLLVIMIIAIYVMFFVRFGGPIGMPVCIICGITFAIFRSRIVKDDELDDIIGKLLRDNQIVISENTIESYDLKNVNVKRRKDGRLVSHKYYLTDIAVSDSEIKVKSYAVDIINSSVEFISATVTDSNSVNVKEEIVRTQYGGKKIAYIKIDGCNVAIPIPCNDYRASAVIEQIANF